MMIVSHSKPITTKPFEVNFSNEIRFLSDPSEDQRQRKTIEIVPIL